MTTHCDGPLRKPLNLMKQRSAQLHEILDFPTATLAQPQRLLGGQLCTEKSYNQLLDYFIIVKKNLGAVDNQRKMVD